MNDSTTTAPGLAIPDVPNLGPYLRSLIATTADPQVSRPELDLNSDGTGELTMLVSVQVDAGTVRSIVAAVADAAAPFTAFLGQYQRQGQPAGEPTGPVPVQVPEQ